MMKMFLRIPVLAGLILPGSVLVLNAQTGTGALKPGHVHIWVTDIERTKTFYRDTLGLKMTGEAPGRNIQFEDGKLWFGKFRGTGAPQTNGITIGIAADSVQAAYKTLQQKGIKVGNPPSQGPGGWSFKFTDPDGYEVEVEGNQ
jgi:predicted enzyme related to lactoylglutathione lyase